MSGVAYQGRIGHMCGVAGAAGFDGIEPEVVMLGPHRDPGTMRRELGKADLKLVSIVLVEDWAASAETAAERQNADHFIRYVKEFPDAILVLCQMPGTDRGRLYERQQNLLSCINAIGSRAARNGVRCTFHPNSPAGSIFRTAADYAALLEGMDAQIGYTADVGHIAKGGMDPLDIIRTYRDRVDHIHFKDMSSDGGWVPTGDGVIDFPGITRYLIDTSYCGWIVMEDESPEAESHPDEAARRNADYIARVLRPLSSDHLSESPRLLGRGDA